MKNIDKYKWCNNKTTKTIKTIDDANAKSQTFLKQIKKTTAHLARTYKKKIKRKRTITSEKLYKFSYKHITLIDELYGKLYAVGSDGSDILILNKEKLSKPHKYWDFSAFEISFDEQLMTFCVDTTGNKVSQLYYKFFFDNKIHEIINPDGHKIISYHSYGGTVAISKNSNIIFYLTIDKTQRTNRAWYYNIYEPTKHYCILYEPNAEFTLTLNSTSDNQYIIISSSSKNTNICYLVNVDKDLNMLTCIFEEKPHLNYYVDHYNDKWYFLLQEKLKCEITCADSLHGKQEVIFPHKKDRTITSYMIKGGHILIKYKEAHELKLINYTIHTKLYEEIFFKGETKSIIFPYLSNINPYTAKLTVSYQTYLTPNVIIQINLNNHIHVYQCKKIRYYNPELYKEKTIVVNKAKTCITILFKKKLVNIHDRSKTNPCVMHVYGAYGANYSSEFDLFNQILLDKGFIVCYTHVRGSSYYGRRWYNDGKMNKKMNTFLDTIDCAEYLINNKITSSEQLTLWGRSAGGLTVGAVLNMRPDLFNFAILGVPFVDVINEMMNKNTPLTTEEYQEWGNPNNKKVHDYIMKYSPYQNIKPETKYPKIYIYSNINDNLVGYWVPLKYYLKMQECDVFKQNPENINLNIKKQYGHNQASNRFEHIGEMAEIYALILHYT